MFDRLRPEDPRTRVAVIGLGRFGASVARSCHDLGYDVTAIDIQEERVAAAADYATLAAQADGSDEEALLSLAVDRSEVAVVGQGQDIAVHISCALILKRIGVPWVIAKAKTGFHGVILRKWSRERHSANIRTLSIPLSWIPKELAHVGYLRCAMSREL